MNPAIELTSVTKSFGTKVAVRDLDMVVPQGALVGYIGPNGAGKTTTIRMIMSILFQDGGDISVLGHRSALEAKDRIGYLPEERGVYKKMKVGAFLRYMARLKGHAGKGVAQKVRDWLDRVELPDVINKRCDELSKGMQQKVQFVSAVIHEPDLLILDEPFSGLDPVNMRLLRELIREQHTRGATVIFSTHVMVQAEQLCDHILMINDGRKVLDDSLASIRAKFDPRTVLVEPMQRGADLGPLRSVAGVRDVSSSQGHCELHLHDNVDVAGVMRDVAAAIPVTRIELQRPTLEDIFVRIVADFEGFRVTKVMHIAVREFLATVGTKGFILGILMTPMIIGLALIAMPLLINQKAPKIDGELAIIDPTGEVSNGVGEYLTPTAIAERRGELGALIDSQTPEQLRALGGDSDATRQALEIALGQVPTIRVTELDRAVDLEREESLLHQGTTADGGRLALVVVHEDSVRKAPSAEKLGSYDLFVREKLDDRIVDEIRGGLRSAIIEARVRNAGLDKGQIEALTRVARSKPITVTEGGEAQFDEDLQILIPMGFMVLLLVSVFTGGQYLMTTTIEEKSTRVVEVLLSAVSPMQLMTGKIVGQMCVGLVIIVLYSSLGIGALATMTLMGLFDPWLFPYLILFYLISYFVIGSLMAAIGAAVNEPREAQTLMMPIVMTVMIPWILWLPISRDPNSVFATVTSFLPPINTFVMLMRMTSSTPPPWWQVWLSILIGVASVYAALWFAAKVFRVGLLLHGKPPSFATLIKWVRMA